MTVAIMQPYVFPYLGYFQLIQAVDTFVFYDDVHFIKKGFINRNSILVNSKVHQFTVPLKDASQNKLIKDVEILLDEGWIHKFFKTITYNYKHAPYFETTFAILEKVFNSKTTTISELAIISIEEVCNYLGVDTKFKLSSIDFFESRGLEKADRLIHITKQCGSSQYVNPQGGKLLYSEAYFNQNQVKLSFIENELVPYQQFDSSFVSGLSIIDVLMFNSKPTIKDMLNHYTLN